MNKYDYPHIGWGVELRTKKGWVLLDGIHNTCTAATRARQSLSSPFGLGAADLRVVALTITRKGETE